MSQANQRYRQLWDGMPQIQGENFNAAHFHQFAQAADDMLKSYSNLVEQGLPAGSVALSMLGATVNLYDIFGQRAELPVLLRSLAEMIESDIEPN